MTCVKVLGVLVVNGLAIAWSLQKFESRKVDNMNYLRMLQHNVLRLTP